MLRGFPGCSHAGFLVGKCHPVAKCETLTAPSLHTPARQSLTTETPKVLQQGQFPLPMLATLHYKRFVHVPAFLGSLGDSPVASYLLFFGAQLLVFFTTNTVWLNQSSEIGENKTNPQLNTSFLNGGFGGDISEQSLLAEPLPRCGQQAQPWALQHVRDGEIQTRPEGKSSTQLSGQGIYLGRRDVFKPLLQLMFIYKNKMEQLQERDLFCVLM